MNQRCNFAAQKRLIRTVTIADADSRGSRPDFAGFGAWRVRSGEPGTRRKSWQDKRSGTHRKGRIVGRPGGSRQLVMSSDLASQKGRTDDCFGNTNDHRHQPLFKANQQESIVALRTERLVRRANHDCGISRSQNFVVLQGEITYYSVGWQIAV